MKRSLLVAAIALIVAPALAGSDILPISGTSGIMNYDARSGQISKVDVETRRIGATLWASIEDTGYFTGLDETFCFIDWGDIINNVTVGTLGYTEYTNSQAGDGENTIVIAVFANDDGRNDTRRRIVQGFILDNIPGSTHPADEYWGYHWRLTANTPFPLTGDDLDGDGLTDFSYLHWFKVIRTPGAVMGPAISGPLIADPNNPPPPPAISPGIEDAFDSYSAPDLNADPNIINTNYFGTYGFTNPILYGQFYFEIIAPGCPNPGAHFKYCQADIGNFNCIVDLPDLAQLLAHYGTGTTYPEGDIEPPDEFFPGDGDVDLADLAEMLGQYGDDCND